MQPLTPSATPIPPAPVPPVAPPGTTINTNTNGDDWCVYEHWMQGQLIFVAATKLRDVMLFPEARNNSEWARLTAIDPTITVRIVMIDSKVACLSAASRIVRSQPQFPRCNLYGHTMFGAARELICSNGQVYANQMEAARALNLNQGHISQHLNGRVASVKGYTFEYRQKDR